MKAAICRDCILADDSRILDLVREAHQRKCTSCGEMTWWRQVRRITKPKASRASTAEDEGFTQDPEESE